MRVGICSGYFALGVHEGHLDLLNAALEDTKENDVYGLVVVIINNDEQTKQKYGFVPVSAKDRYRIIEKINKNFDPFISVDEDGSVAKTLDLIESWLTPYDSSVPIPKMTFYNSGDRDTSSANQKELEVCERLGIEVKYLDMPKRGSSSDLIQRIKNQGITELRMGGKFSTLYSPAELAQHATRSPLDGYLKPGDIGYI